LGDPARSPAAASAVAVVRVVSVAAARAVSAVLAVDEDLAAEGAGAVNITLVSIVLLRAASMSAMQRS
jgi:hypothetical protein